MAAPAVARRAWPSINLDGKRILIVEHDQAVQKILLEHLEPTGCTALTVARADEARQHLRDGIDLVVADFNLDGVDWLELLGQVAARGTAVGHRFIFITAGPMKGRTKPFATPGRPSSTSRSPGLSSTPSTLPRWLIWVHVFWDYRALLPVGGSAEFSRLLPRGLMFFSFSRLAIDRDVEYWSTAWRGIVVNEPRVVSIHEDDHSTYRATRPRR